MRIKKRKRPLVYGLVLETVTGDEFFIPNKYIRRKEFEGKFTKNLVVRKEYFAVIEKYSFSFNDWNKNDLITLFRNAVDFITIYYDDKKIKYETDVEYGNNLLQTVEEDSRYIYFCWDV